MSFSYKATYINEDSMWGGYFSEQLLLLIFKKIMFKVFLEHTGISNLKNVSVVGYKNVVN